jgi:hypothetical protein
VKATGWGNYSFISSIHQFAAGSLPATLTQGSYMAWNCVPGSGKTYFVNGRGLGPGGFSFQCFDSSGNYSRDVLNLDATGQVSVRANTPPTAASLHVTQETAGYDITRFIDATTGNYLYTGYRSAQNTFVLTTTVGTLSLQFNGGYVGIGTLSPTCALDVSGDIKTNGKFRGDGSLLTGIVTGGNTTTTGKYTIFNGQGAEGFSIQQGTSAVGVGLRMSADGTKGHLVNSSTTPITFTNAGNVGINRTNPEYTVDVTGSLRTSGEAIIGGGLTSYQDIATGANFYAKKIFVTNTANTANRNFMNFIPLVIGISGNGTIDFTYKNYFFYNDGLRTTPNTNFDGMNAISLLGWSGVLMISPRIKISFYNANGTLNASFQNNTDTGINVSVSPNPQGAATYQIEIL